MDRELHGEGNVWSMVERKEKSLGLNIEFLA